MRPERTPPPCREDRPPVGGRGAGVRASDRRLRGAALVVCGAVILGWTAICVAPSWAAPSAAAALAAPSPHAAPQSGPASVARALPLPSPLPSPLSMPLPLAHAVTGVQAGTVTLAQAATLATAATPVDVPGDGDAGGVRQDALALATAAESIAQQLLAEAQQQSALAVAAQAEALQRAQTARTEAARAVAAEQARINGQRVAMAHANEAVAHARAVASADLLQRVANENRLAKKLRTADRRPDEATVLFHEVIDALESGRAAFAEALDALGRGDVGLPDELPPLDVSAPGWAVMSEQERRSLSIDRDRLAAERAVWVASARESLLASAAGLADHLDALVALRTLAIDALPAEARDELFGWTQAGYRQLVRELRHLELMARWYPQSRLRALRLPDSVEGWVLRISALLGSLARLMVLALLWWISRRHWRQWLDLGLVWLRGRTGHGFWGQSLVLLVTGVRAVGGELMTVIVLALLFGFALSGTLAGELALVAELLRIWAWIRLLQAAAYAFLTGAASDAARREISPEIASRILRTLRIIARAVWAVLSVLAVASHLLGRGYLYLLVVQIAWLAVLPILLWLVRGWQGSICDAYLQAYPGGALTRAVEAGRDRWYGVVVALLAFSAVAMTGIAVWAGEMALRFEQTRRLLAFLFRRRLESAALALQPPVQSAADLPDPLRTALTDHPADAGELVGGLPQLQEIADEICTAMGGGPAIAGVAATDPAPGATPRRRAGADVQVVALVGAWGVGKTTWLQALRRQLVAAGPDGRTLADRGVEVSLLQMERTQRDGVGLIDGLARELGLSAPPDGPLLLRAGVLGDALAFGPARVVLLDDAGRVLLASMGGSAAWDALAMVIQRSAVNVAWVVAISDHAQRRIGQLRPGVDLFARRVELTAWDENRLGDLIEARMRQAGATAHFDDLIDSDLDAGDALLEGVRVGERFIRLLWDQADGNPRDALNFWARSLAPVSATDVRVRLFEAPSADAIERLGVPARFLLHALVAHDGLTPAELAAVLFEPEAVMIDRTRWLCGVGIIEEVDGYLVVAERWHRAVVRYLQRKHLLLRS